MVLLLARFADYMFFSLHVDIDSGFYTVKFNSVLLKDVVVEADCIIPPLREDDPLSSDSDLDDTEDGHLAFAKGVYGLCVAMLLLIKPLARLRNRAKYQP